VPRSGSLDRPLGEDPWLPINSPWARPFGSRPIGMKITPHVDCIRSLSCYRRKAAHRNTGSKQGSTAASGSFWKISWLDHRVGVRASRLCPAVRASRYQFWRSISAESGHSYDPEIAFGSPVPIGIVSGGELSPKVASCRLLKPPARLPFGRHPLLVAGDPRFGGLLGRKAAYSRRMGVRDCDLDGKGATRRRDHAIGRLAMWMSFHNPLCGRDARTFQSLIGLRSRSAGTMAVVQAGSNH
jgi:hypothetical protein